MCIHDRCNQPSSIKAWKPFSYSLSYLSLSNSNGDLFTLTTATLGLFLTAAPTGDASASDGDGKNLKSFLDVANTICDLINRYPDDISKVVAPAENTIDGGSGPGNGSPANPGQYVFKLAKQFCDHIKHHQPKGPSSSQLCEGSARIHLNRNVLLRSYYLIILL